MNEKIKLFVIGFLLGLIGSGIGAGIAAAGTTRRSAGEIADLNRRYDQLNRDYTERQRKLESSVEQCIGYAESARGIIERTGENAGRAIGNLREASALIKQGIKEREDIKMELDNLRAGLYRIRDLGGNGDSQIDLEQEKNNE